jgi:chromosome segregation ATPase
LRRGEVAQLRADLKKARQDLAEAERVLLAHRFERVNGTCGWTWKPPLGPVPDFVQIERLEKELATAQDKIKELREELTKVGASPCVVTELSKAKKELAAAKDSIQAHMRQNKEVCAEYQGKLRTAEYALALAQQTVETLERQRNDRRDDACTFKAQLDEAQRELTRLKSFACGDVLTHEANFALQNLNQLRKEHDLLKAELEKVKNQYQLALFTEQDLNEVIAGLRQELAKVQILAKTRAEKLERLTRESGHAAYDHNRDQEKIAELQDALDSNKHDYEVNQKELAKATRDRDTYRAERDQMLEVQDTIVKDREEIRRSLDEVRNDLAVAQEEAKRWEAKWHEEAEKYLKAVVPKAGPTEYDLTKDREEIASLTRQLDTERGICGAIKKERDVLKKDLDRVSAMTKDECRIDRDRFKRELDQANKKLAEYDATVLPGFVAMDLQMTRQELDKVTTQRDEARQELDRVTTERDEALKEWDNAKNSVEGWKSNHATAIRERDEWRAAQRAVQKELEAFKCRAVVWVDPGAMLDVHVHEGKPPVPVTMAPYLVCRGEEPISHAFISKENALDCANQMANQHPNQPFRVLGTILELRGQVSVRKV